jgi:hypothetical protein
MEVVNKDTFECVIDMINQHHNPVCLDFASASNPAW